MYKIFQSNTKYQDLKYLHNSKLLVAYINTSTWVCWS